MTKDDRTKPHRPMASYGFGIRCGGQVRIDTDQGMGISFAIREVATYRSADGHQWQEVSGKVSGETVYLELNDGEDGPEAWLSDDTTQTLEAHHLSEETLIALDEGTHDSGIISNAFGTWHFVESFAAEVEVDGDHEGFYCWYFIEPNSDRSLTIEKYEDEPFEVSLSQAVPIDALQIL